MPAHVRDARGSDAAAIREVAVVAWRDTYAALLQPGTIGAFIEAAYSVEMLERRIARHVFLVAEDTVAADVLSGNRKGEVFYERRGFIPREVLEDELYGEPVIERRGG
jgi:hypothetical protein